MIDDVSTTKEHYVPNERAARWSHWNIITKEVLQTTIYLHTGEVQSIHLFSTQDQFSHKLTEVLVNC